MSYYLTFVPNLPSAEAAGSDRPRRLGPLARRALTRNPERPGPGRTRDPARKRKESPT